MTFFYDLNKKLAGIADKPETKQLTEGAVAEAGYSAKAARAGKDIGKPGKAFAQIAKSAGERYGSKERGEKVAGAVLAKLRGKNESVEEGALGNIVQKIGGAAKKAGGAVLSKLGHGSDEDMIRDLQKKAGVPQTGQKPKQPSVSEEGGVPATPKQKKFAALAEPKDKITFADKIVGAKKEVDEMLGDVAAEAMKAALSPKQKKIDMNKNGKLDANDFAMLRKGGKKVADEDVGVDKLEKAYTKHMGRAEAGGGDKERKRAVKSLYVAGADKAEQAYDQYHQKKYGVKPDREETDEGWDEMEKDVKSRMGQMKTGEKRKTSKGEVEKTSTGLRHTRSYDAKTGETDTGDEATGEKRGRGRPKKTDKAPERVTAKATKHKGGRKGVKEDGSYGQAQQVYNDLADIRAIAKQAQGGGQFPQGFASRLESVLWAAMTLIKNSTGNGAQVREEELDEKAVSKQQQKFMGMAHAMQKGEKIPGASKELKKVARTMKKGDVEDFAKTKHKGLPEKVKSKKKEEDVEESSVGATTAGSVAPASGGKSKGVFGKGIYDSMNREVEAMIAESMNISMNMNSDEHGGPSKSLTVTATDEDAVYLGKLLKMAGVGSSEGGCGCGSEPCSCGSDAEVVDENSPDWPTNTETNDDSLQYSGGVNGPKSTGQTVGAPFNRQIQRQGPGADGVKESEDLAELKNLAGIQEAKVEEDDVEEGNKFTGNLAKARAAGKKEADLDGDGDMEKVRESVSRLWKTYKG